MYENIVQLKMTAADGKLTQLLTNCQQLKMTIPDGKEHLKYDENETVTNCNALKMTTGKIDTMNRDWRRDKWLKQ